MRREALEWRDRFERYLVTERRVSPHTVTNYRLDLAALMSFCDDERLEHWLAVDVRQVRAFCARSAAKGLAAQSVQRRLSALRTFMSFLVREGVLPANPAKLVQGPKVVRKLPTTLDPDQMQRLIEIPADEVYGIRDRAMMELLYSSALRLIELVRLDRTDLDFADRTVRVLGKGNVTRIVPVGSFAIEALKRWRGARAKFARPDQPALFVGRGGRRLNKRAIQTRVAYWARRQGISLRVYPHLFRHSCATHVLESCGDIRAVQELLGHASISTTAIYTNLNTQHLIKVYEKTHPRAHRKVSRE
jgi:integrase/recombinase XerC